MSSSDFKVQFSTYQRPQQVLVDGRRLDGRSDSQFRLLFLRPKALSQAQGSAYIEFNNTKVMLGIFGPRQLDRYHKFMDKGRLECDFKVASFATPQRGFVSQKTNYEKECQQAIIAALEPAIVLESYPKCQIEINCLVLESGGSDLAVAICAATLALVEAGIEMRDLVSSCCISRQKLSGDNDEWALLLDPTSDEQFWEDGHLMLAMMPGKRKVTQMTLEGQWAPQEVQKGMELGMGGCLEMAHQIRKTLMQSINQQEQMDVDTR